MARQGLNPAIIMREAAGIVDVVGAERLTLARIAQQLDVRLPSLYKHIDSLAAVRAGVATLATEQLAAAITAAAVGRSGADALTALAAAYRDYARAHPGRYAMALRAPDPQEARSAPIAATMNVINAVLASYGLAGDDALDAARAVRAALHGFATLETAGGFGFPRDVDASFARLVSGLDIMLGHWPSTAEPATARPE